MREQDIQSSLRKANPKLMSELNEQQVTQAVAEFQQIYSLQMSKVVSKVNRYRKVLTNLSYREQEQESMARKIEESIREKMQVHIKKRKNLQLQKLKTYKHMQLMRKDKLNVISQKKKTQEIQILQKSNRINKEIQQFWENKNISSKQNDKKKQYHSIQIQRSSRVRLDQHYFMTQTSPKKQSVLKVMPQISKINQENPQKFPNIQRSQRLKTLPNGSSVVVNPERSEFIRQHLLKSDQQWKQKDDLNFQKVMQKMDKILKIRVKVKRQSEQLAKMSRQNRILKQNAVKQISRARSSNINQNQNKRGSHQKLSHDKDNYLILQMKQEQVRLRREQIQKQKAKERQSLFESEKKKQKRSLFHLMVKQAVNLVKNQALRKQL